MGSLLGAQFLGISSTYAFLRSSGLLSDGAKLFALGFIAETGRRLMQWLIERFRIPFYITAKFNSRDPAYQWLISFLTDENVWLKSRNFQVEGRSSQRKWKVKRPNDKEKQVDYVPAYGSLHFFRWKGYWLELQISEQAAAYVDGSDGDLGGFRSVSTLTVRLYTLDNSVLFAFVEECRLRYVEHSKPKIIVHSTDSTSMYERNHWNNVKVKPRRPLESLILVEGLLETLLADAREFLRLEDWYAKVGIPHRRGYLLYGPPGTGKTSTAGELGLEIYNISLASSHFDDSSLARAISRLPPRAILLIEDIDCAFSTREDDDEMNMLIKFDSRRMPSSDDYGRPHPRGGNSQVTLSGLLNVLDGVGSEEGKLFFATTNHLDRLDPALIRPGRIDLKIEYKLANRGQARAMFRQFFPESKANNNSTHSEEKSLLDIHELSDNFSRDVPEHEFSTAELQGYLINWKLKPYEAAQGVKDWVEQERETKRAREARVRLRQEKLEALRRKEQLRDNEAMIVGIGAAINHSQRMDPKEGSTPSIAGTSSDKLQHCDTGAALLNQAASQGTVISPKAAVNGVVLSPADSPSLPAADVKPHD